MPESSAERPPLNHLVDTALAQDSRRFQKLLSGVYHDPDAARDAFRGRAAVVGPRAAGSELAATPEAFGAVRADLTAQARAPLAREAGYVGGLAYLLQQQRESPEVVAKLLTERFFQGAKAAFEDASLLYRAWGEAVRTEGPQAASERLAANPGSFAPLRPGGERYVHLLARRALDAEHARAHAAEHQRAEAGREVERQPRLPTTIADLELRPGGRLPRPLELKLEAFAADFRGKLSAAYLDPARAEATFHEIAGREGLQATVASVRRSPQILGPLTPDPNAGLLAHAAARRGARAYELNAVRNPAHAAELLERETLRSFQRQVANPAEALRNIQAALRTHGIEAVSEEIQRDPLRYFAPLEEQTLSPTGLAAEVRALADAGAVADHYVTDATARRHAPRPVRDLPVDGTAAESLQAHADATRLQGRKGELHVALNNAANALRRVEDAVKWYGIRQAQLRSSLRTVFADPLTAEADLIRLAEQKGATAAIERLTKSPHKIGPLVGNRSDARRAAVSAGARARDFFEARDARDNVQYTDPEGTVHLGVEKVRAATTAELGSSAADLTDTETRLREVGGVEGSRARAIHAVQALSPEQADRLVKALQTRNPDTARPLQVVRDTAAARRESATAGTPMLPPGTHHTVIQVGQLLRSAGEGPTM